MDYEEAKFQLLLHGSGTIGPTGQPLTQEDGFLGSLRPYSGLHEKNFHLVMEALLTVGERVHRAAQLDRDLAQSVWRMCSTARSWGLHPAGMLQRNRLITAEDTARLELWVDSLETTALNLLGGRPPHHAVYHYAAYVVEVGWWDNVAFFIALMDRAVSDPEIYDAIEMITKALEKLGGIAAAALPSLREAAQRSYTWATPAERCTEEVRAQIRRTIQAIEGAGHKG
jgi:hypothetical protein